MIISAKTILTPKNSKMLNISQNKIGTLFSKSLRTIIWISIVSVIYINCSSHINSSSDGKVLIDGILYHDLPEMMKDKIEQKIAFPGIDEVDSYYSILASTTETLDAARTIGIKNLRRFFRFTYNKESWPLYLETIEAYVDSVLDMGMTNILWINFSIDKTYPKTDDEIEIFSEYCEYLATGLKGKILTYNVFGEINREPILTPEEYMKIIKVVIPRIRQIDPNVKICAPSLNVIDYGYMEALLELGIAEYTDIVSINPYIYGPPERKQTDQDWGHWRPILPDEPQSIHGFEHEIQEFQKLLRSYKSNLDFEAGEFGWVTNRIPVWKDQKWKVITDPEKTYYHQALYLVRRMILCIDLDFKSVCYFTDRDKNTGPLEPKLDFGIIDKNGNPKPSYYAYETINKVFYNPLRLKKPEFNIKITDNRDDYQYHSFIRNDNELILAFWAFEEDTINVTINNSKFLYPVKLSIFSYEDFQSLNYQVSADRENVILKDLVINEEPVIIRFVQEKM
jgi:hypothetical protein